MIRRYIIEADDSLKGFDEAIEKLEREWGAEEIEGSEDCISREQAVYVASGYCAPQNIADELRKLPSVTPQPKRGEWIDTGNPVKISFARLVRKEYYNQRNEEALKNDLANDIGRNLLSNNCVWFKVYDEGIDDNYKIEASLIVYKPGGGTE